MLNNFRNSFQPYLEKIGKSFSSTGLSANFWTLIALLFAFASAIIYGMQMEFALIIGGALLLISGFFDVVDGQVARYSKTTSKRGAFLDSVFDKIAEVAIFLGILIGNFADAYLVFLAIVLSLLVSYVRARAESIGIKLEGIGIGERAERLLVLAIIGMIGFMEYAILIVIIIATITLFQRIITVYKKIDN